MAGSDTLPGIARRPGSRIGLGGWRREEDSTRGTPKGDKAKFNKIKFNKVRVHMDRFKVKLNQFHRVTFKDKQEMGRFFAQPGPRA